MLHGPDIHTVYDDIADDWARNAPKVHDDLIGRPVVVRLAHWLAPNGRIVDLGCGDGNACRLVSKSAQSVIGLDLSTKMLRAATRMSADYNNISYVRGDLVLADTVLASETFDLCLSLYATCCVQNRGELARSCRAMCRLIKPGGYALIQIPHPLDGAFREDSLWIKERTALDNYFEIGRLCWRELRTTEDHWMTVARYHFPEGEYVKAIRLAGLRIERLLEPRPSRATIRKYPTLGREARLPSSLIFVTRRLGTGQS